MESNDDSWEIVFIQIPLLFPSWINGFIINKNENAKIIYS